MRIAILSDIHDHLEELGRVLAQVTDCAALLCLGDLCSPFTLKAIAQGFDGAVHVVWGNNDGDKLLLTQVASQTDNVTLHGDYGFLTLGERKIALTHYRCWPGRWPPASSTTWCAMGTITSAPSSGWGAACW